MEVESESWDNGVPIYAVNLYYGVFYPATLHDRVRNVLAESPKFSALTSDDRELHVTAGSTASLSVNSDYGDETLGFIFIEEMTIDGGLECCNPVSLHFNVDTADLVKREREHKEAVATTGEMYSYISSALRKSGMRKLRMHHGWKVVTCAWTPGSSSGSDDKK